ncbi:DNA repair protein RecN [Gorillibacterium sp. sgz5001074]|uniref:DNA repair protein RecN n=1 Tax=Gorillibacterium sp. sgz5001074 TaxID=3446695 RepID=UPI003F66889E
MLLELSIRNLAVIESVKLSFHKGFHVLTGETGAGKSIIIDALSLIAGSRGASDLVRYGQDKAEIEALFDVPENHPVWEVLNRIGLEAAPHELLIIRREINAQGKSVSRINGQLVNLGLLREAGEWLVNIHGQHEHQSLLKAEAHIEWLDLFGGKEIAESKGAYIQAYEEYNKLQKQLNDLKEAGKQALQMQDLYRFQVEEISDAKLKPGEDESLSEEKRKLGNAEKLFQNVNDSYEGMYANGKALDLVRKAVQRIQDIADYDAPKLQPVLEQMQSAYYQLEDAAYQLRDYRDQIEFNPARLDQIEDRLSLISSLRRKYGENVVDILAYLGQIKNELSALDHKEEKLQELESQLKDKHNECVGLAGKLSALRRSAGLRLAEGIERELKELHMERTKFHVNIIRLDEGKEPGDGSVRLNRQGMDQVEFLIAPNPGEPLRGLGKIASGGELSRIMLAMKSIFAKMDQIPVLVFDEVDTGVSGRAAQAIAERMARLSSDCQVFSITHLPQVACMADAHYYISKAVEDDRTFTKVRDLEESDRTEELARMLGGVEITETTLHHAKEMLALAIAQKTAYRKENQQIMA